jgi:hypothetical protein
MAEIILEVPATQDEKDIEARARSLTLSFLRSSISVIDKAHEEGYARKNPHLVGEVLKVQQSVYDSIRGENA